MSQVSLQDVLKGLQKDFAADYDRAAEATGGPSGAYDVDLPQDREYRAVVTDAKFAPSKSSGREQITITFEITEPAEWAGAKFQEYIDAQPVNEISSRKLASLFGALQATAAGSNDEMVAQFIDKSVVIATRRWGQENDRNGLRWANADVGQDLRTNIKPPKPKKNTTDIRPEINIPKAEEAAEPFPEAPVETAATPDVIPQTTTLPGGVNLPPGLRG